jgi:hypothetical protein
VQFQLTAPSLDFYVAVRLRQFDRRWLAVADIAGEPEVGLGNTAHQALTAALSSFGTPAVKALLADLTLWRISQSVIEQGQLEPE